MANHIKLQKKGAVAVQTKPGQINIIKDVFYVPNLAQNLVSIGYRVEFSNDQCTIADKQKNLTMEKIKMSQNKVFPLNMPLIDKVALKSTTNEDYHLWHLRYRHLGFGLPNIPDRDKTCEGCIYEKIHYLPFPKISPLEIVHADICGPTQTPSLNNNRYFLLFADDYTRMMWVYILKQKSEAFQSFLNFKARVGNEIGKRIKILRTNRGGEFIGKSFMNYYKEKGIHRQLTIRYSLQ